MAKGKAQGKDMGGGGRAQQGWATVTENSTKVLQF